MQVTSFSCPHCSAILRIRDQKFVGRHVDCPDCGNPFEISSIDNSAKQNPSVVTKAIDEPGTARQVAPAVQPTKVHETSDSSIEPSSNPEIDKATRYSPAELNSFDPTERSNQSWMNPQRIGWGVAAVVGSISILTIFLSPDNTNSVELSEWAERSATDSGTDESHGGSADLPGSEHAVIKEDKSADSGPSRADQQLTRIGIHILDYATEHSEFPSVVDNELAEGRQLSWLSKIAYHLQPNKRIQPDWELSWDHSSNDRFVRQKFVEFHNPSIPKLTSDEGYPATHYVGIGGVGSDATLLPAGHSRAGIFGHARRVDLDDIPDGKANTMMMSGVVKQLGSWAASGPATIRSLTKEPYINGPDGLGTGQKDGMYVLFADGSVRFVSSDIASTVIRRMASANDRLPLDPTIQGEPGDSPPTDVVVAKSDEAANEKVVAVNDDAAKQLPEAQPAPEVPPKNAGEEPIDVAAQLKQPIAVFALKESTTVRVLLLQIEEMAGVPVLYDESTLEAELDKKLTLNLKSTTVGGILIETLKTAGLTFEVVDGALNVVRRSS